MSLAFFLNRIFLLALSCLLTGCGYHSPYGQDGNDRTVRIYHGMWQNHTNEFAAEARLYNSINDWLQKAKLIERVGSPAEADYILEGEIVRASHPALSHDRLDRAREIQANLAFNFSLTNSKTGEVLFKETSYSLTRPYLLGQDAMRTADAKKYTIATIANDLAEHLYVLILDHTAAKGRSGE